MSDEQTAKCKQFPLKMFPFPLSRRSSSLCCANIAVVHIRQELEIEIPWNLISKLLSLSCRSYFSAIPMPKYLMSKRVSLSHLIKKLSHIPPHLIFNFFVCIFHICCAYKGLTWSIRRIFHISSFYFSHSLAHFGAYHVCNL